MHVSVRVDAHNYDRTCGHVPSSHSVGGCVDAGAMALSIKLGQLVEQGSGSLQSGQGPSNSDLGNQPILTVGHSFQFRSTGIDHLFPGNSVFSFVSHCVCHCSVRSCHDMDLAFSPTLSPSMGSCHNMDLAFVVPFASCGSHCFVRSCHDMDLALSPSLFPTLSGRSCTSTVCHSAAQRLNEATPHP